MRDQTHSSTPQLTSAFTADFLARLTALEEPASAPETRASGPWEVEPVDTPSGVWWAVVRRDEPVADGGTAFAVLTDRASALLVAACLPAVSIPNVVRVGEHRKRLGVPVHHGQEFLGHLARPVPELAGQLHLARCLVTRPDGLGHVLEALGPEGMSLLGRDLERRVTARQRTP